MEAPTRLNPAWAAGFRSFRYPGYTFDVSSGRAEFTYVVDGPGAELRLTEHVWFPLPAEPASTAALHSFRQVVDLLYVIAGTSYYKLAAPTRVVIEAPVIAPGAVGFAQDVFRHGLAEFAYTNDLPHVLDIELDVAAEGEDSSLPPPTAGDTRPLVAVGGGKDSIVSLEALRDGGLDPVAFVVDPNHIRRRVIALSGISALVARRVIDPALLTLSRAGAYRGHTPFTAINSLIAVATAVLHGLGPVVMSNERSASLPNLVWHGREVNHQWSKSLAAEEGLGRALRAQAGLEDGYFSLLRPLSELHIARLFARDGKYDGAFTSCNEAFRLEDPVQGWCADCPKCRFVYLALAPFMPRSRLVDIFRADMFTDPAQVAGYRELLGLDGHKPFECVGDDEESLTALEMVWSQGQWHDAPVVAELADAVLVTGWPSAASSTRVFTPAPFAAHVPPSYRQALETFIGS